MLTEIYTEALLVDKNMTDQVWELRPVTEARFRCKDCGENVEKQVRPPVPTVGGAVAYILTTANRFLGGPRVRHRY